MKQPILAYRAEFRTQQGESKPPVVSRDQTGGGTPGEAAPGTPQRAMPSGQEQCYEMLPYMLGMVAIFYFLLIRPQQKQEKQRRAMLEAVKEGDKVVTTGGIHGTVSSQTAETVVLRIDPKVKITMDRANIARVLNGEAATKTDDGKTKAG